MARKPKAQPEAAQTITAYKGFNADWTCRGFQYEIGKTYTHSGPIVRCAEGGFHACENPLDVWNYYPLATSKFATVELGGEIARAKNEDSKVAAAQITVRAEIALPDFIKRAADWVLARATGNTATGYRGHAAATGYSGHAAATGDRGHAAATGYRGHAAATGDRGHAAATGDRGHAAATGYSGHAAATGCSGHAAAMGDRGHAAATGYSGHAAATGDRGHAAATGKQSIAASLGVDATAMAGPDGWIVLAAWKWVDGDGYQIASIKAARVGTQNIEAGVAYKLTPTGKFVRAEG